MKPYPGSQLNVSYEKRPKSAIELRDFIQKVQIYARLPKQSSYYTVSVDDTFKWDKVPAGDLTIGSTHREIAINRMLNEVLEHRSSCLFAMDSGKEKAQV